MSTPRNAKGCSDGIVSQACIRAFEQCLGSQKGMNRLPLQTAEVPKTSFYRGLVSGDQHQVYRHPRNCSA